MKINSILSYNLYKNNKAENMGKDRIFNKNPISFKHHQNFSYDDVYENKHNTVRIRHYSNNNKEEYRFSIYHDDKESFAINRSFSLTNSNSSVTQIGDEIFFTSFDDKNMKMKIKDTKGKETEIDFNRFFQYKNLAFAMWYPTNAEDKEKFYNSCKNYPADVLLDLNKYIDEIHIVDDEESGVFPKNKILTVSNNLGLLAHELGHCKDYENEYSSDTELIEIYNNELSEFSRNSTQEEKEALSKFTNNDLKENLDEMIAEANVLRVTYGINKGGLEKRAQYLISHFSESLEKIYELMENGK